MLFTGERYGARQKKFLALRNWNQSLCQDGPISAVTLGDSSPYLSKPGFAMTRIGIPLWLYPPYAVPHYDLSALVITAHAYLCF